MLLNNILAMRSPLRLATIATLAGILFTQPSLQQTYTKCNPLTQTCQPDPALGRSIAVDFTSGPSNEFTSEGNPSYNSNGAGFSVSFGGDAPQINSNWYIMFGKVEITMKAAPGVGIVSSVVLQSDDLDEIDWEWLGADNDQVQTNYFGKGETGDYDRGGKTAVSNTQGQWHTYTVDWTEEQIVWSIDGKTVRVLAATDADPGQYPQTPCQLKIGSWSGGDSSLPAGTIAWAGGPTDYSQGPFTMYVQSVSVVDYSTGSQYIYGDQSGDWTSIESKGGKVNGNAGGSLSTTPTPADPPSSSGSVVPFFDSASTATASGSTSYPGLPSGWSVNPTTGKVIPPSSAPVSKHPHSAHITLSDNMLTFCQSTFRSALSTSSPAVSPAPHCSNGGRTVTHFDQRGFKTTQTIQAHNCEATGDFAVKVAQVMGVTQTTVAAFGTAPTENVAPLPTDITFYQQEKQSAASTVTARRFAGAGTLMATMMFAIFLA